MNTSLKMVGAVSVKIPPGNISTKIFQESLSNKMLIDVRAGLREITRGVEVPRY